MEKIKNILSIVNSKIFVYQLEIQIQTVLSYLLSSVLSYFAVIFFRKAKKYIEKKIIFQVRLSLWSKNQLDSLSKLSVLSDYQESGLF